MYDTDVSELLIIAAPRLRLGKIMNEEEREPFAETLEQIEDDLAIQDIIAHTEVSETISQECREELRKAAQRGWRIRP